MEQRHLEVLQRGAVEWNAWRISQGEGTPDLSNADLRAIELVEVDFSEANLDGADLGNAILEGSDLRDASLVGAKLGFADLKRAKLAGANLSGADLTDANLRNAVFSGTRLVDAVLIRAAASNADFTDADFRGANLFATDLSGSDLRFAKGVALDSTIVRNAKFDPKAEDLWSTLKREYSGTKLVFHLLLLVTFLMPYVFRTLLWVSVNTAQTSLSQVQMKLLSSMEAEAGGGSRELAQYLHKAAEAVASIQPCLAPHCRNWTVGELLLNRDEGLGASLLTMALFLYNICRVLLTWLVGPMREEEERTGYTPPLDHSSRLNGLPKDHARSTLFGRTKGAEGEVTQALMRRAASLWNSTETYGWLVWPHRLMHILIWLAATTIVWHLYRWVETPVLLPGTSLFR